MEDVWVRDAPDPWIMLAEIEPTYIASFPVTVIVYVAPWPMFTVLEVDPLGTQVMDGSPVSVNTVIC